MLYVMCKLSFAFFNYRIVIVSTMDNQKWEVVSYGKNKKGGGQKLSKAEKKKRAGTMPTIDPNGMSLGSYLMMIERLLQTLLFRLSFQCQDGIRPKRGRNFQ